MAKIWRNSKEYRNWKKAVLERDGNKCVITGSTKHLHAHHIEHASYNKELRYAVSNGVTLHKWVHLFLHIILLRGYRKKCTKKDWLHLKKIFKKGYVKVPESLK